MISYKVRTKSNLPGRFEPATAYCCAIAALATAAVFPIGSLRAQTADPSPPLTPAQSAKLNQKVAAAEASGADTPSQIVSETFTGNVIGVPDDHSIRVHRDDKNRDETVTLYGVRSFSGGTNGGKDALSYLTEHLKNAHVKIEGRSRDRNGMLSALVTDLPPAGNALVTQTIDGSGANRDFSQHMDAPTIASSAPTVNYALLRLGLGRFDVRQLKDAPDLSGAEASARKEKKGGWATEAITTAGGG